jgi:MoaA/NifB/PqqE/SkfB family radical SAM enzyme
MCPRKQTKLSAKEFTLKQFEDTLSLFPSINSVILLGRGETFMMRDIFPILDLGTLKNIHFTIITNGTLLTPETIKKMPYTGKILVSIDHPHADQYRNIRRGGDLNKVVSNLKKLKELRPEQWLCIQAVIMNSNIDYLDDFVKLAKDVSADAIKFIHPVIFEQEMNNIHIQPSKHVNSKLAKSKAYAKKLGIRFVAVPQMKKPRVCVEPWLALRISLDGNIYPCCYIDNSNASSWREWHKEVPLKVAQSNYIMGNIYDHHVCGIWNGKIFRALRKEIINTRQKTLLPTEELNALRSNLHTSRRFSYCSVCLYRQNQAC